MALCRILMKRYEFLILDEPTAAMDMESTLASEECIRRYCDETGCGVLLITHSISQARRLADQIIVLHEGKLIERGDTERVLSSPPGGADPAVPGVFRRLDAGESALLSALI